MTNNDNLDFMTIVKSGFGLLQRNMKLIFFAIFSPIAAFIPVVVVVFLALAPIYDLVGSDLSIDESAEIAIPNLGMFVAIGFVLLLVGSYISLRIQAGTLRVLLESKRNNSKPTIADAWLQGKAWMWQFLGVSLLAAVVVVLGFIALIIPGLVAIVYLSLVNVAAVDGHKGFEALKQSRNLVKRSITTVIALLAAWIGISFLSSTLAQELGSVFQLVDFFVSLALSMVSLPVMVALYDTLNNFEITKNSETT